MSWPAGTGPGMYKQIVVKYQEGEHRRHHMSHVHGGKLRVTSEDNNQNEHF